MGTISVEYSAFVPPKDWLFTFLGVKRHLKCAVGSASAACKTGVEARGRFIDDYKN